MDSLLTWPAVRPRRPWPAPRPPLRCLPKTPNLAGLLMLVAWRQAPRKVGQTEAPAARLQGCRSGRRVLPSSACWTTSPTSGSAQLCWLLVRVSSTTWSTWTTAAWSAWWRATSSGRGASAWTCPRRSGPTSSAASTRSGTSAASRCSRACRARPRSGRLSSCGPLPTTSASAAAAHAASSSASRAPTAQRRLAGLSPHASLLPRWDSHLWTG
mmetsp:Transcript_10709/g.33327  ORF Transcript_10709/g.33327 Transcript_10709/m.33327 type:complete len:213 (+) Transcript_10709:299-937(+)